MDRLDELEIFVTVIQHGSLAAAGRKLRRSAPAVTRAIASLEQRFGTRLVERTTRRLAPTEAGLRLAERAHLLLHEYQSAVLDTADTQLSGLLRITCSQSLGQTVLVGAVAQYLKRHPQVAVDLQMNNRTVNLVEERIDLALRITNELDPNLIARPLSSCASVICASPAYLAAHGMPRHPQDLALHNCLTYSYFGKSLWHFDHQGVKSAVAVSGNLSANESVVLMAGTVQGAGISMQPYYSAAPLLASGELIELMPEYRPQSMGIYGIYTSRRQMPATLRTMLDFLVEWFATDADWRATLR